jgi:hypothetical protein
MTDFFPKLGFCAGFFLYIINFAGRVSEAAMGGSGGGGGGGGQGPNVGVY